jgi:UDP-N-acetylmuramoylalanine--D-glutamate ligase
MPANGQPLKCVCNCNLCGIKNWVVKTLFLGLGKVNQSIANHVEGEKVALVEEEGAVAVFQPNSEKKFCQIQKISGSLDTIDLTKFLPARVFISPGIDPRRPFLKQVAEYEVRELTFFCSRFRGKIIGITGTDGKSTFTKQLGEILKRALPQKKIFVGGNLGIGMADALSREWDIAVLEISSFQAERIRSARLHAAVLINLDIDHLDRYDSLEDYHRAKWNLLKHASEIFYPTSLPVPFDLPASLAKYDNRESIPEILKRVSQQLAKTLDFEWRDELALDLPTLPHRLQTWQASSGHTFVNDSKATTVHAVMYGLQQVQVKFRRVHLILGGKYKGDDFTRLSPLLRDTDEILIVGEASAEIQKQMSRVKAKVHIYGTLRSCLEKFLPSMKATDCLLLSPGCSSYDEFENFEERGEFFLQKVKAHFTDAVQRQIFR